MKTLLIVDVQNDFCPGGALAVPDGDKVVPPINTVMDKFDLVIASKDWHPKDTVHFEKWPPHCVKETKGAEFHPDLKHTNIDRVFLKGTGNRDDGYSAFEATNHDLEAFLKERDVDELYVAGLATDYCVKSSAIDASRKGFKTIVLQDAIRGVNVNDGDDEQAIVEMKAAGVKMKRSSDL